MSADVIDAARAFVVARVESQMDTVHAGTVAILINRGMTRDEIRDFLVSRICD